MAGEAKTITIKEVSPKPWPKPESTQIWHTVVIEEYPSEPIKFIQDTSKSAPAPEVGKQYEGMAYMGDKGLKFYVSGSNFQKRTGNQPYTPNKPYQKKTEYKAKEFDSDGAAWGNALTNAVSLYGALNDKTFVLNPDTKKEDMDSELSRVVEIARYFFNNRPNGATEQVQDMLPSDEEVDKKIDLADIPFN